jgi:TPR repeat protein
MKHFLPIFLLVAGAAAAQTADPGNLDALKRAAEQGQADAQYELGVLYEFGFKWPDHRAVAYVWYNRAADQGNPQAAQRRDALKVQLTPAELERAAQLVLPGAPPAPAPVRAPEAPAAAAPAAVTPPASQ